MTPASGRRFSLTPTNVNPGAGIGLPRRVTRYLTAHAAARERSDMDRESARGQRDYGTRPDGIKAAAQLLEWAIGRFGPRLAVVTSLQREGIVVLDLARRIDPGIRAILLDTGRLPAETYRMVDEVKRRLGVSVEVWLPDPAQVKTMVSRHGAELFRADYGLRRLCCHVRKVETLRRALTGLDAWVTGLRPGSSPTRRHIPPVQSDPQHPGKTKVNPLASATRGEVEAYTDEHNLPTHPLYAAGYRSIGCAPCTRATRPGEDERAGRWWWEPAPGDECGLHGASRSERFDAALRQWREDLAREDHDKHDYRTVDRTVPVLAAGGAYPKEQL
jgi:phosphoadenosine phosphosulfate reductase